MVGLIERISNWQVSAQVKIKVMQRSSGNMPLGQHGMWEKEDFFTAWLWQSSNINMPEHFWAGNPAPYSTIRWGKAESHQLFQLTAANHGKLSISMYVELDFGFFGIGCAKCWSSYYPRAQWTFDTCHKTKFPAMISCNLIKIGIWGVYTKVWWIGLGKFWVSNRGKSTVISQFCVFHHCKAAGFQLDSVTLNTNGQQQLPKNKPKNLPSMKMGC